MTLEEILTEDLSLAGINPGLDKTAGAAAQTDSDEIEKLAAEIGLVPAPESQSTVVENGYTKEAGVADVSMDNLYNDIFPEDAHIMGGSQEKVAAEIKTAAEVKEAAMGAVAYDAFEICVDRHIEKIAEELTGDATVSTSVNETLDGKPVQTIKDNQPANSALLINTDPKVMDEVTATPGDKKVVGVQSQIAPAGNGEKVAQVKQAAYRQALLLSNLDTEEGVQS